MSNIRILLLAAGASLRMGTPKQMLPWGKETLIEIQIDKLLATEQTVDLVLGAHSNSIIDQVKKFPIGIHINSDWKKGMGNSIAYGMKCLFENNDKVDGVLITLIDQPLITTAYYKMMLDSFVPGTGQILMSKSNKGWTGAPVLFDQVYFKELLNLGGDEGARQITIEHQQCVQFMDGGEMLRDMDTPEAYQALLKASKE